MTRLALGEGLVRSSVGRARNRLGRAGRFGQPGENSSPVFGLLTPNQALRATENPRVDGSIPSLATISNWCIPVTWFTPHSGHLVNTVSERRLTT